MTKITENDIELWAIEELENLGWQYIHGVMIAPDGAAPERSSFGDIILKQRLQDAIAKNNTNIPYEAQQEAVKAIERIASPELMVNNQLLFISTQKGTSISFQKYTILT